MFQAPIKYEIKANDQYEADIFTYKDVSAFVTEQQVQNLINKHTVDFKSLLNHEGLININFIVQKGSVLVIIVSFDHPLVKKEFNSLYTDLQAQLIDGIGRQINEDCLAEYTDKDYTISNKKELKMIKKQIYCMPWQDKDWKLIFITNHFYDQQTYKW